MSRRSNLRKRASQKRRYAQRPQPVEQAEKPIVRVKTAGLFGAILDRSRAFDEALLETQHTKV
jgi:hypothetical protein